MCASRRLPSSRAPEPGRRRCGCCRRPLARRTHEGPESIDDRRRGGTPRSLPGLPVLRRPEGFRGRLSGGRRNPRRPLGVRQGASRGRASRRRPGVLNEPPLRPPAARCETWSRPATRPSSSGRSARASRRTGSATCSRRSSAWTAPGARGSLAQLRSARSRRRWRGPSPAPGASPRRRRERLEPPEIERLPERGGDAALRERARPRGHELLAEGAVAVLVVAGGQGTRLGFDGPKGAFPLGPVSRALALRPAGPEAPRGRAPLRAARSLARDDERRHGPRLPRGLRGRGRFGLAAEDVRFFTQGSMPAVDFEGRLLLEAPGSRGRRPGRPRRRDPGPRRLGPARGARGPGRASPLVLPGGQPPRAARSTRSSSASTTSGARRCRARCSRSATPGRARRHRRPPRRPHARDRVHRGRPLAPRAARRARRAASTGPASIAIHVLSTSPSCAGSPPTRSASCPTTPRPKAIPCLDPGGRRVVPDAPNGYKLERFVFDALPEARRVALLEVRRARGVLTDQESERQRVALHGARGSRRELPPLAPRSGRREACPRRPGSSSTSPGSKRPKTYRPEPAARPATDWILFGNRGIA